jgi:formylglycine-generating enzyme required for sulfatase activity
MKTFRAIIVVQWLALSGVSAVGASGTSNGQLARDEIASREVPFVVEVKPVVAGPGEASQWEAWCEALQVERQKLRERLGYDGGSYQEEAFAWVPSCYCCCFAMMYDQRLYDPAARRYTIDSYLNEGMREFGGYDAIVLWQAYPRIGFDGRNQFDFYRDMPGGLAGLRELSRAIHRRGVKVFIDYNPWDTGTRREGKSDAEVLAEFVRAIEADGIFLDTLHEGMKELRDRLDAVRPGVVLESELTLPVERIRDHHMSWAQWFQDSRAPGVLWNKWFERRHMMHQIQRWNHDHTGELQMAWMNGSGMLVWENVFGTYVGWSRRDRSILRSMLPVQRRYVQLFSGEDWTPLVPTEKPEVYASLWRGGGLRLWTLVNRSEQQVEGTLLRVPHAEANRYFDLMTGREVGRIDGNEVLLGGRIRPRGIGAFVAGTTETLGTDFEKLLATQAVIDRAGDWDSNAPHVEETLRAVELTKKYRTDKVPRGMVVIPAARLCMSTQYRNRECGFYRVAGQEPPAQPSRDLHKIVRFEREVSLAPYAIDRVLVTNSQYAEFLKQTGYRPREGTNFLKHWRDGRVPPGLEDQPVVYVDLEDARTYARWAGKRLATEEQWQHAAQGAGGPAYSWGNVWEWTESERSDGRTRFCILKGGSHYQAKGSDWYADGGAQPCDFAAKFLLLWPGLDRCATIGFRCAADLVQEDAERR